MDFPKISRITDTMDRTDPEGVSNSKSRTGKKLKLPT